MWMSTTHVARLPKRGQSTDSPLFQAPRDGDRYNGVEPTPLVPSIPWWHHRTRTRACRLFISLLWAGVVVVNKERGRWESSSHGDQKRRKKNEVDDQTKKVRPCTSKETPTVLCKKKPHQHVYPAQLLLKKVLTAYCCRGIRYTGYMTWSEL